MPIPLTNQKLLAIRQDYLKFSIENPIKFQKIDFAITFEQIIELT